MARRYLSLISFDEALTIMRESFPPPGVTEVVSLELAVGRVTAEPVFASYPVPGTDLAGMDGIAVHSWDTRGAGDRNPVLLDDYWPVNTGEPVPEGYDAVIMIEDVWAAERGACRIRKSAFPGQFIRPAGEDIRKGDIILEKGHLVRPWDVGGLATYGITSLLVNSASIGFIPTGDELITSGTLPGPGHAVESNSIFARSFFSGMGATCRPYPIVPDDPEKVAELLYRAVSENDLVILSAGSSAGIVDYTEQVISSCGSLLFHGVAMKPGTPVMLGRVKGKPVLGVPGYPIATSCTIREFAGRLLEWWGLSPHPEFILKARISHHLSSDLGYQEFVPVSVGKVGQSYCAVPHSRGNGIQMSIIRSNGYLAIPASHEGIEAGEEAEIHLMAHPKALDRVLLITGIKDECIFRLGSFMADNDWRLHVCSSRDLDALHALQGGYCHAASVSMPVIGSWMNTDIFRPFNEGNFMKVTLAEVELGLASREGLSLSDLPCVKFLNRPHGASARALVEELMLREGIVTGQVHRYCDYAKTDEGVITAIVNRTADAGICRSESAARAGLAWKPIGFESFEMVFPLARSEDPPLSGAFIALRSTEYQRNMVSLGYSTRRCGHITPCLAGTAGKDEIMIKDRLS